MENTLVTSEACDGKKAEGVHINDAHVGSRLILSISIAAGRTLSLQVLTISSSPGSLQFLRCPSEAVGWL